MKPAENGTSATPHWSKVTVVGCGLVGSSFALALRQKKMCARIAGWDKNPQVLQEALRLEIIDEIDEAFAAGGVSNADLIYLATPVRQIVDFLRRYGTQTKSGCIITDSGSSKVDICRAARGHLPPDRFFVGGHPMAGSQNSGLTYAQAKLFAGAPYILTNDNAENKEPLATIQETLESLGANVKLMSPAEHDRTMALISHLPQLLSSALAAVVDTELGEDSWRTLAGNGYTDMTRLAGSSWSIWRDIFATNATPVAHGIDLLLQRLIAVREELKAGASGGGEELPETRGLFDRERSF